MTKSYKKKKAGPKSVSKYRTPKNFRGKIFGGKKITSRIGFSRPTFKVQHKG